jgi:gliding motility-associated-like protein
MKTKYIALLILVTICLKTYSQTVFINSITASRQTNGDNGYTLDGVRMAGGSRLQLLNANNFGSAGTYPKNVTIFDGYVISGSLTGVASVSTNNLFFFGSFNKLDASTQQFTNAEIDSLYNWSLRGGKLIIATGGSFSTFYDANILNSKWGYTYQSSQGPSNFIPTTIGNSTDIFNGPFGHVFVANQGAASQGYFNSLTSNPKVLATDASGNPTLFMDCNTLDLIIADVDGYTDMGGITFGATISNEQDKFWANTIVFMDRLQPIPIITNVSNTLSLNSTYNNYQWYLNDSVLNGATNQNYLATENGNYHVEVTMNGGCKIKSNTIIIIDSLIDPDTLDILLMPNVFTPNNDGINDIFIPVKIKGITINQILIYNRWGQLIHKESSPIILWDGKIKNENSSDGVYYWIIEYQDSKGTTKSKAGFLQLLR